MEIRIIKSPIKMEELKAIAAQQFGSMVKAVVDIEQEIMAVGGEMHADEETFLMEREGSKREHTWGINLQLEKEKKELIEFDSIVNLKPSYNNRSRSVDDIKTREKIRDIVDKLIAEQ